MPTATARPRVALYTALAMVAFAGNSVLCRLALGHTRIDPASFTLLRLASGALMLWTLVRLRGGPPSMLGNWPSAFALFVYAAAFSLAYVRLGAAAGALLLFGSVQVSMVAVAMWRGERLRGAKAAGLALALAGLVGLLLPGLAAPPPGASASMVAAGIAWAVYTLRGRGGGDPTRVTAGNFARATILALVLAAVLHARLALDAPGIAYALASGALASGLGYAIWYGALPHLKVTSAAAVQLSVPVIAAAGGVLLLGERPGWRLALASAAVLGGIALVLRPARAGR